MEEKISVVDVTDIAISRARAGAPISEEAS